MAEAKSWEVSDELWSMAEPLLVTHDPRAGAGRRRFQRRKGGGRKPLAARQAFAAIVYVLRTGCQWKALPPNFGSGSAVHARFQRWRADGFFLRLWRAGLAEYDELEGIAWTWQSIDGTMGKAPLAQEAVGRNPTDRGKKGTKRSLLVDGAGVPLSLIVSGANRHDVKLLPGTLDAIVVRRPKPTRRRRQHLCGDKAYSGRPADRQMRKRGYTPHVRRIGQDAKTKRHGGRPRRWVVERSHSWFNRFRKILVRYEKKEANYLALTHCAAAIICFRMC
ncbi:MAG TPA: IS5 family transposase [Candidatus Didemnitutus sp.]